MKLLYCLGSESEFFTKNIHLNMLNNVKKQCVRYGNFFIGKCGTNVFSPVRLILFNYAEVWLKVFAL